MRSVQRHIVASEELPSNEAKVAIVEITLTDHSKVYDVEICPDGGRYAAVAHATSQGAALKCFKAIVAACFEAADA